MIRDIFFTSMFLFLLTGCEGDQTTDWYVQNKQELINKLGNCKENDNSTNCLNAREALSLIQAAALENFKVVNQCRIRLDNQFVLMDKIVDVEAACPQGDPNTPKIGVDVNSGTIDAEFTGAAKGVSIRFTRKWVTHGGIIGQNEWTCHALPSGAYEQFLPEICRVKLVYR